MHHMDYDFLIVGAGIAGASLAYELSRHAKVLLLEAEDVAGYHTTGRSAALFAPTYGGPEIRAITRASRAFFDAPPTGFCDQPLLGERGCLYPARADQLFGMELMADQIRGSGGDAAIINAEEARTFVPLLRKEYVAAALLDRDAMDIDVNALHQGFLRGAKAAGTNLVASARVLSATYRNGKWTLVTQLGSFSAAVVVNTAGAWADEFAILCGAQPVGLTPYRRTAMLVDVPREVSIRHWPAVIDIDEEFYFKPDAGKLLLSPADEIPDTPRDVFPDQLDIAIGVDRVQTALDIEVHRISHSWAGLRTFVPDRNPVVGFDSELPAFFWCAGQGGYGIQTAPALARVAAALATNRALPEDVSHEGLRIDSLSPARFRQTTSGVAAKIAASS